MVRDSASELDNRYFAVNSYLPKYCSMRKGLICMVQESGNARSLSSSAKLTGGARLRRHAMAYEYPPVAGCSASSVLLLAQCEPVRFRTLLSGFGQCLFTAEAE